MSYSEIYQFGQDGDAIALERFRNGFGSAPRVWGALIDAHKSVMYPNKAPEDLRYVNAISNAEDLWTKAENGSLPLAWWEHNLLRWTYDNAVLKREHFSLMIASIQEFERAYPVPDRVNHLPRVLSILEALVKEAEILGVGYYHTSVTDNPWSVYNRDTDESRPYNLNADTRHHFIEMKADPKSALIRALEGGIV